MEDNRKVDKKGFKIKKITSFKSLKPSDDNMLPPSDLCFTDDNNIYQFDYIEPDHDAELPKIEVNPGIFEIKEANGQYELLKTELSIGNTLSSINNTSMIKREMDMFFKKLHVYKKRNQPLKRGILLYGPPGTGKTTSIKKASLDMIEEDGGTVCLIWPTAEIDSEIVSRLFTHQFEYSLSVTRIILITEDIGGGALDPYGRGKQGVSSSMLNFLDGVNVVFKKPTFIVATTNYPENLLEVLADRPGRFDQLIELSTPSQEERLSLVKFIAERDLTEEEIQALSTKEANKLSISHLREIVIRSELHDKTFVEIIKEMADHTKKIKEGFQKRNSVGFDIAEF